MILKRQWFISSKLHDIKFEYKLLEELGRGAYGKVFKSQHIETGLFRAIKMIQKINVVDYDTFITEIEILKNLDHPNIINIIETFESERICYLVLEYYSGGDMFERIIKEKTLSETKAALIMRSLFSAVMYCHDQKICHRDLKPENCLYISTAADSDIKIIDFGLSVVTNEEEALHDIKGTPYYIAPEILSGNYNMKADCWSLGVILYMLLSGTPPFKGKNNQEILMSVYNGAVSFRSKAFKVVSDSAKDLISRLLVKDPSLRLSSKQAYNHEWLTSQVPILNAPLPFTIIESLSKFVRAGKLKKAALMYIASKLNEEEISTLRNNFIKIDVNGDGVINKEELSKAINEFKEFSHEDINKIVTALDFNYNGSIDYTEFITACLQTHNYTNVGLLKSAFRYFDADNSGFITVQELKNVLHGDEFSLVDSFQAEEIIKEADLNMDGKIDYKEFITLLSLKSLASV